MRCSEAEDADGLTPVKDDNEAATHFIRRTLLFLNRFDYKAEMPRPTLNNAITGRSVRPATIGKIAKALGVPVEQIIED